MTPGCCSPRQGLARSGTLARDKGRQGGAGGAGRAGLSGDGLRGCWSEDESPHSGGGGGAVAKKGGRQQGGLPASAIPGGAWGSRARGFAGDGGRRYSGAAGPDSGPAQALHPGASTAPGVATSALSAPEELAFINWCVSL